MKYPKQIPKVKGRCGICNSITTDHHYFCNTHYPEGRQLKHHAKDQKKTIWELQTRIERLKQGKRMLKEENKQLREQLEKLKEMIT